MKIMKIMNERRNISTDLTDIKRVMWMLQKFCQFNNSDEMGKFLERHKWPNLTQEIENLNSLTFIKETEFVI